MARRQEDLGNARTTPNDDLDYDSRSDGIRSRETVQSRATDVDGNGTAIAALVIGLLAATFGFLVIAAPAAILFGLIALVLGAMGMSKAGRLGGLHKGLALTGLLSGLLGLLLGIAVLIGGVTLFNQAQDELQGNDEAQQLLQDHDDTISSTRKGSQRV
jgi:hypothetical protein